MLGIAVSAVFLFLVFRKIDLDKMMAAFRGMDFRYLWPALLLTFVSYYLRAVRWKFLLFPIKRTSLGNLFSATLIGYMGNNIFPARLGEFMRAYALARKEEIDTSAVFATLVVDRLCDGFTMLLVLVIAFFTVSLPPEQAALHQKLVNGGYLMLGLYLVVIAFLVLLKKRTEWTIRLVSLFLRPFPDALAGKITHMLVSFIHGIRLTSSPSQFAGIVLSSLAIWATAIWPVDLLLRAFGLPMPLPASLFIMVFLVFAVMVPASPGSVGTYEYAGAVALTALGVNWELSVSIALVIHALSFFPVIPVGFYCMWRDKLSVKKLSQHDGSGAPA
ncbi:lysylphosphatidylglycerol synthase transmembrane domain-containing protein [Geomonas sp.]|uniref:lysylphosphatidylglycerol synthase transmembrane domain-containing protein n=1 Tax=Geomonas sp. TaxID=2651584 RepID=UPI002B46376C|nr:lysylphosphatidylglycerol synthase transmembrane domain-containing protein [Geomonas sp.]HJV34804.1 lysylphosphatidylglycerol synthase transmembrane domain-containing protein [Geomonas sp.]